MPQFSPFTDVGQVQREVDEVRRQVNGKANDYEVHAVVSRLDSLEHTVREISTTLNRIQSELHQLQADKIESA